MSAAANEHQVGGEHYGGGSMQHWDWCVENQLGYLEGQITKYISRWRRKNGRQDLEKALHYADKLYEVKESHGWHTHFQLHRVEVRGLARMVELYGLSAQEELVFTLAASYRDLTDINVMRGAIRNLLKGV
jgi:hypothetical protein